MGKGRSSYQYPQNLGNRIIFSSKKQIIKKGHTDVLVFSLDYIAAMISILYLIAA